LVPIPQNEKARIRTTLALRSKRFFAPLVIPVGFSRRGKQRLQSPFELLFHVLVIPEVFAPEHPIFVDERVAGKGGDPVAFADDSMLVEENRQVDPQVLQKLLDPISLGRRILGEDGEHLKPLTPQLFLKPLQVLEVLFARLAPGREKGKNNGLFPLLFPVFLQSNSLPFQSGSDESGSYFPYLSLSGSPRKEEKPEKEKEKCSVGFVSQYGIHGMHFIGSREGDQHPLGAKKDFPSPDQRKAKRKPNGYE
jgi:hypothetical protein